jgi:hypothetical protein
MDLVSSFVDSFRQQLQFTSSVSTAALAAILFSWARMFGVVASKDMRGFRWPRFLIIPLVLLLAAILIGYFLAGGLTGYYYEVLVGYDFTQQADFDNGGLHFQSYYVDWLQDWARGQLICAVVGMTLVAGWYAWNVLAKESNATSQGDKK